MPKIWLITGSSRGLGRQIAEQALARGDCVVATARDTGQLAELVARYGERVRTAALDVTDSAAAEAAVELARASYGRLDVLVNNAGYGHIAPFEQTAAADFRAQFETNFHGVANLCRAALPLLRAQRAGHIIQVSSIGGRIGTPGLAAYQAAKWAVGGFSEALSHEVAGFGVRVSVLEPGAMRTGWGAHAIAALPELLPDYRTGLAPLLGLIDRFKAGAENENPWETSDPARVAAVVLGLADHPSPPLRLLLGSDALRYAAETAAVRTAADAQWHEISQSTDAAWHGALPAFPRT